MARASSRLSPAPLARNSRSIACRRSCSVIESRATSHERMVDPSPSRATSRAARALELAPSQSRHKNGTVVGEDDDLGGAPCETPNLLNRCQSPMFVQARDWVVDHYHAFRQFRVLVERREEERQGERVAISGAERVAEGRCPRCGFSATDGHAVLLISTLYVQVAPPRVSAYATLASRKPALNR